MTKVCRLCLVRLTRGSKYFNINAVESFSGFMPYRDQLTTCIPEMALDLIPNPIICNVCRQALRLAYDFKSRCLQVEEKIRKHVETQPVGEEYDLSGLANFEPVKAFNVFAYSTPPNPLETHEDNTSEFIEIKNKNVVQEMVVCKSEPEMPVPLKSEEPEPEALYRCPIASCALEFDALVHLQTHQLNENHIPKLEKYRCSIKNCHVTFDTVTALSCHKLEQHGHLACEDYSCNFCSQSFRTLQLLRRHNSQCQSNSKPESIKTILTKRPHLPTKAKNHLKKWLFKHTDHPYPTDLEKQQLMTETNLTLLQVENWFINARRRILQDLTRLKARRNEELLDMHTELDIDDLPMLVQDDGTKVEIKQEFLNDDR